MIILHLHGKNRAFLQGTVFESKDIKLTVFACILMMVSMFEENFVTIIGKHYRPLFLIYLLTFQTCMDGLVCRVPIASA